MSEQRPFAVGDEVYLIRGRRLSIAKVERVTKTQAITAAGTRYRQSGGLEIGYDGRDAGRIERKVPELDRRWAEQALSDAAARISVAALRGMTGSNNPSTPSEIRAAYAAWDKLEKEVNGE